MLEVSWNRVDVVQQSCQDVRLIMHAMEHVADCTRGIHFIFGSCLLGRVDDKSGGPLEATSSQAGISRPPGGVRHLFLGPAERVREQAERCSVAQVLC